MKLTILNWIWERLVVVLGRSIEFLFRLILCVLPLGLYMLLLQERTKASSATSISVFTKENSRFQHVFPGFLLVSIDPDSLNRSISRVHSNIQEWVKRNKYILALLFMTIVVGLMVLSYIRGGNL